MSLSECPSCVDHEANSVYEAAAYRKALTFGGSAPHKGDTP